MGKRVGGVVGKGNGKENEENKGKRKKKKNIYIYIIMDLAFLACVFTRMGLFILKNVFLKFFLESPLIFVLLLKRKTK